MKTLTDDHIREIHALTKRALLDVAQAWEMAARGLPIRSKEYRRICRTGRELQDLHHSIVCMAEDRGVEIEPIGTLYGFN